jgi:hypothetical protein
MSKLKEIEGQIVTVIFLNPAYRGGLQREKVKLLHVDDAGIWIENQTLTNEVLEAMNLPATDKVAVFFHPYAAIHAIFVSLPGTSLSEKAFGV